MLVSDFDYHLPPELIAQKPLPSRENSRMMICRRDTGEILHSRFTEIARHLDAGDVLVLNTSRVLPARAWGKKPDGTEIEFLFLNKEGDSTWQVLCRPAKKAKPGDTIIFGKCFQGRVVRSGKEGKRWIRFDTGDVLVRLKKIGYAPLPPYIKRQKDDPALRRMDLERYQTVYAKEEGSIAAPTAGLHFSPEILDRIQAKGVQVGELSLDVGLATFQPVRTEIVEAHRMLEERFSIPQETARLVDEAKKEGRSVAAVGTTTVRALESAYTEAGIRPGPSSTRLFIFPGYRFKVVDKLLTNFHLPRSTLLMLVSAFAGTEFIRKAYTEAVHRKYRFYSYGDCMLIL